LESKKEEVNILLVEDDPAHAAIIRRALLEADSQIQVRIAGTLAAFRQAVAFEVPHIALVDLNLPDGRAIEILTSPPEAGPFPILIMTSYGNEQVAVETMKAGALDYIVKSAEAFAGIPHTVERARREWNLLQERKQIGETLRKSEENFRRSLDDSPLGVRVVNAAGETIYANRELLALYGYDSVEEINRIPIKERYTPQSYGEFKKRRKAREEGKFGPSEYEISIVRKNGEVRHLQVFRKAILWNGAKQFQTIYHDITERKKAETQRETALKALCESEDAARAILNATSESLFLMRVDGTVLALNESAARRFGKGVDEMIGVRIDDLMHKDLSSSRRKMVAQVVETKAPVRFEDKRQGIVFENCMYPICDESGNMTRLAVFSRDISKRKRAEKEKETMFMALQASLTEKNVLLKEVHHRVKNNLMIIIGLIKMQETKANNEMLNALLQDLEGRVRVMALVHDNLNKSENLARIDMQKYLETMIAQINTLLGPERGINFRVQATGVEVGLDIAIPCGLIMNELITNAFKYAFPGDKSRSGVRNCEIAVSVSQDDTVFTLEVADNGVGLPANLDWEQTETMGLRLVKMLSQQLKGIMEIDRAGGTTFRLRFAKPYYSDKQISAEK
jgi:PAS domain S-box-containing protein